MFKEDNTSINVRPAEFELTHIVWKTNGSPLTYGRCIFFCKFLMRIESITPIIFACF